MKLFYRIKKYQLSQKAGINLNGNIPNKIHIIGSVGSGKTTLARNLSRKYNIPYYELDNVVWKRHKSEDIRRSDEERDEYLDNIIRSDRWIIEGAHNHEKKSKPMILNMLRQDNMKSMILKENSMIDQYLNEV